jgi:hypothetical protein
LITTDAPKISIIKANTQKRTGDIRDCGLQIADCGLRRIGNPKSKIENSF